MSGKNFETLNESDVHRALKIQYAARYGGRVEQPVAGKVCDILTPSGDIIEIQTASLVHQVPKIALLIESRRFRLVYPLVTEKIIELYDNTSAAPRLISRRKSPKRLSIYALFRELTGLVPWLDHPNFTLEVVPVKVAEERIRTAEKVQSANGLRRRKQSWLKKGKRILEQEEGRVFRGIGDYAALLPPVLGESFTVKELREAGAGPWASYMVWVLEKAEVLEFTGKRGKERIFRKTQKIG